MYVVTTAQGTLELEADEHRVEGLHVVFRRTAEVMGRPRVVVVRRLASRDVLTIQGGPDDALR